MRGLSSFKIAPIAAVLPTENGFVGHTELFSEPLLRHAIFFSQAGNEFFVFRLNHFASPEEKDSVFFVKMLPHKQQILLDKLEFAVKEILSFHLFLKWRKESIPMGRKYIHHATRASLPPILLPSDDIFENIPVIGIKVQLRKNMPCIIISILSHLSALFFAFIESPVKKVERAMIP